MNIININRIKENHIISQSLQIKHLIKFTTYYIHTHRDKHTQINLRKVGIEENFLNMKVSTTNKSINYS